MLQAATCNQQLLLGRSFTISDPVGGTVEPLETSGSRHSVGSKQGKFSYDNNSVPSEPRENRKGKLC